MAAIFRPKMKKNEENSIAGHLFCVESWFIFCFFTVWLFLELVICCTSWMSYNIKGKTLWWFFGIHAVSWVALRRACFVKFWEICPRTLWDMAILTFQMGEVSVLPKRFLWYLFNDPVFHHYTSSCKVSSKQARRNATQETACIPKNHQSVFP